MFCFLSLMLSDGERNIYEVVRFDQNALTIANKILSWDVVYMTEGELKAIYTTEGYQFDFSIENGYLIWDGSEHIQVKTEELNKIIGKVTTYKNNGISLYDMLFNLIDHNGYFLDKEAISFDEGTGSCIVRDDGRNIASSASINISKSSMRAYYTVKTDEGFRVRSIIQMVEGNLEFNSFHFTVPKQASRLYQEVYSAEYIGDTVLYGREVSILRLDDGLSIYPFIEPEFLLFDPMVNFKVYNAERDRVATRFLDYFLELRNPVVQEEESFPAQQYSQSYELKYGVFFKSNYKNLKYVQMDDMIKVSMDAFTSAVTKGWSFSEIIKYIEGFGFDNIRVYACVALIQALLSTNVSEAERLACVQKMANQLRIVLVKEDLELFSYRSYMYMSRYRLPQNVDKYTLHGGSVPDTFSVKVVKEQKEWI